MADGADRELAPRASTSGRGSSRFAASKRGCTSRTWAPSTWGSAETVAGIELTPVSVGNPHAVVVGDPDEIERIGPLLETHPRFPQRTNVQVVRVDAPGEVTARVWERGVGETTASGSSAVAVAAATHAEGEVLVHFRGGDLRVRLRGGRATLIGPAERA